MAQDAFAGVSLPRSPVYGTRHMVVSGHSLASIAGLRAFERGGSVVDAMIATSAALSVIIPQATSLGGDAFILYRDAGDARTVGLNASGPAPALATPERFAGGMVEHGPLAAVVPGMVRGWEAMHARYGRLPWQSLFDDAIRLAEEGHPLSRVLAAGLHLFRTAVSADPGLSVLYLPQGEPLAPGTVIRQPALAETLRRIRDGGAAAFYEGPVAETLTEYVRAKGGLLTAEDFSAYAPEWVTPIETVYRGHTVHVMPPNSYGMLMLLQLNALSGMEPETLSGDATTRLHTLITAMQAAFAEGEHHIADPRTNPAPIEALLGPETTARLQAAVRRGVSERRAAGRGGTSCIVLADAAGNACSVVQSVFHVFGSAFLDPGTGILLNNRMLGFTTDPAHASVVAPRKRPAHTLNPTMTLKDGKVRWLLTTPGGPAQTISLVQVLTHLLDGGRELSAAIEAPRWSIDYAGNVLLEAQLGEDVAARLAALGHRIRLASGASYFGSAKTLELREDGVLLGAADARREAFALGA